MMKKHVTIRDVADEAGVSAATVSRVINRSPGVSADKSSRVRRVIERLDYRPNHLARDLSQGSAVDTVGVLVPKLADEFTGTVVTGIERELRDGGYHMLCALSHADATDEQKALRVFLERRVSGLILLTPSMADEALLDYAAQEVPLVVINRHLPEIAVRCVHLDNHQGGYLATRHLLELGHIHIAHIAGPLTRQDARERLSGFRTALEASALWDEGRYIEADSYSAEQGRAATAHLLRRQPLSAIFAANDLLAAGAYIALREAGLSIPKDISVVGFDDRSITSLLEPPLTSVHYPMVDVGRQAAHRLLGLIQGSALLPLPLLTPVVSERRSAAPAPHLTRKG